MKLIANKDELRRLSMQYQNVEQHQTNIDLSNLSTDEIKDLLKDE
jgi:hypothetical protein